MKAELFERFGIYVRRDFFPPELCERLRSEALTASDVAATVRRSGADYVVDESARRTRIAQVSEATLALVEERLLAVKPELERHFDVRTEGCRPPQFLIYREGDFFKPHSDVARDPDAPRMATGRRVSMVVFLSREAAEPGPACYGGGQLTFYGLLADERARDRGLPLTGESGMLVAFRPDVVHAVSPVTHGARCTVVSWLEA
jgi:predicted 2-oxoglutarate/Fe(II)-dependent dioxygenase YbiX